MKNTKKICIVTLSLVFLFITISMTAVCLKANTEDPKLEIRYCNLSFRDSVCIKYAVSAKNTTDVKILIWNSPQSDYTIGTESEQITSVGKNKIDGEDYVIFDYSKLVAKQMTDVVYARAYTQMDGVDYYSDVNKYSILQYAYNKLGKTATESTDENLKAMLTDMLEYGASAQKYFEHNSDRLATDCFYQVKLSDGVLDDGCMHGLYIPGDKITLKAAETDINNIPFSHWINSQGEMVSEKAIFEVTVTEKNEVYTPVYSVGEFTVLFKDWDGSVLKTEFVKSGNAATAPADPDREGYVFAGWDKAFNNVTGDLTVIALYELNNMPTLTVGNITAKAGDEIEIPVNITNNPGLLSMTFTMEYNDSVILIDWVDAGADNVFRGLNLQEPAKYKDGCNLVWYGASLRAVKDGEAMLICATIADDAPAGTYSFKFGGNDVFDQEDNPVTLKYVTGTITITG